MVFVILHLPQTNFSFRCENERDVLSENQQSEEVPNELFTFMPHTQLISPKTTLNGTLPEMKLFY